MWRSNVPDVCRSQSALLQVLPHASKPLRHTAGTIITSIVGAIGLKQWSQLVAALLHYLQSSEADAVDGALDALFKVEPLHVVLYNGTLPSTIRAAGCAVLALGEQRRSCM